MACTKPKLAYKDGLTENGKQKLTFKWRTGIGEEQQIPCGKCLSCKLDYAKEWALRIYHEASLHWDNCFITLTYNDENLPEDKSVHRSEVVNFIKRLRKYLLKEYGKHEIFDESGAPYKPKRYKPNRAIKTFYCGEYGDKNTRPHYHVIVLGYDFPDKEYLRTSKSGHILWESKILDSLWKNKKGQTKGFANIGDVTFESAGYVARYCLKKQKNKVYTFVDGYDEETGEITKMHKLNPEFIGMSQGIGKDWYKLFKEDTYKDYLETNGFKNKIPRYYDKQLEKENPELYEKIKLKREQNAKENEPETKRRRLHAKNLVKQAQEKMLKRSYEEND
jgi:hypothetical protein